MSAPWLAYRALARMIGVLAPAGRPLTGKEGPLWDERLGRAGPAGPFAAWIHAASLGEAVGVPPLANELEYLDRGARMLLTATTMAGRRRLLATGRPASLAPLDAPQIVARFFARARPARVLLLETELWPHWLLHARVAHVPVVVVSARLSARSVERYARLGADFRGLVAAVAGVVCQGAADAARWRAIGAPPERVAVGGNLKHDALPVPSESRAQSRLALGLDPDRPLLVLGSLRPGEARIVADAWRALPPDLARGWQVVAVPRHARATRELQSEAGRDLVSGGDGPPAPGAWRWDDRVGVLAAYYAAAEVAFVGGSLAPWGGHNPLEPAACGTAVLMGPHHASQLDGVRALEAGGALIVVHDAASLAAALARLMRDDAERTRRGAAGRAVAVGLAGAARRTAAQLAAWGLWPPA